MDTHSRQNMNRCKAAKLARGSTADAKGAVLTGYVRSSWRMPAISASTLPCCIRSRMSATTSFSSAGSRSMSPPVSIASRIFAFADTADSLVLIPASRSSSALTEGFRQPHLVLKRRVPRTSKSCTPLVGRANLGLSNTARQPHVTFHDLRHAFASIMIERGLTSTVLAHVMGHRDATTTERKVRPPVQPAAHR